MMGGGSWHHSGSSVEDGQGGEINKEDFDS